MIRRKLGEWPEELLKLYGHHIRRCLNPRDSSKPVYREGEVALCLHCQCKRKRKGTEYPLCNEYAAGLCCEVTLRNGQEPISSEVLRVIYGRNPVQMKQDIQNEIGKLLKTVLGDPVLCEMLEHIGLNASRYADY